MSTTTVNLDELSALRHAIDVVSADRAERLKECKAGVRSIFQAHADGIDVTHDVYLRVITRLLLEVCRGAD